MTIYERRLLISTFAILATLAILYFAFKPVMDGYHQALVNLATRKLENQNLEQRKTELSQIDNQLKQYQLLIGRLDQAVPADEAYAEMVSQTATMASQTNITLTSIQPTRSLTPTTASISVALTIRGSFNNMIDFTSRLQNNLRPISIKSLNVVENGPSGGGNLSATLQVEFAHVATQGGAA